MADIIWGARFSCASSLSYAITIKDEYLAFIEGVPGVLVTDLLEKDGPFTDRREEK